MESADYLAQILDRLNAWMSDPGVRLSEENTLFVRDDAVDYRAERCRAHRSQVVTAGQFPQAFGPLLAGGPNWIHANAIPLGEGRFLIAVIAGRKIGSGRPKINVGYESEKTAEIIPAETLATTN